MAGRNQAKDRIPALEWIAAGLGLLIAVVLLGTIGWQAVTGRHDAVPVLDTRIVSVTSAGRTHVVTLAVTNASSRTAASVQVEGTLARGTPDEETSSASVDYVPGHGEASGALIFTADPRRAPLELRVTGYEHP